MDRKHFYWVITMHNSLSFPDYKAICSSKEIAIDMINKVDACTKCDKIPCISYVVKSNEKIILPRKSSMSYELQEIIQKYMGFNYILNPIHIDCYYSTGFMAQVIGIADLCQTCQQKVLIPTELFNKLPAKIKCMDDSHYIL